MYEEILMKRFKDLNSKQKYQAIDYMLERDFNAIKRGEHINDTIANKIKDIKQQIKFCGCNLCDINLFTEIKKILLLKN